MTRTLPQHEKTSILLSVYQPNPIYLEKQLRSLNEQDYDNLELLVWNDSPWDPIDKELFQRCITKFPVSFFDNGTNLGYCGAFEQLTALADGTYVTYCDQDDIWLPDKISGSIRALEEAGSVAAVCDRAIIDENDDVTCPSVRHSSSQKNETWDSCSDILVQNSFLCYAPGLCITLRTDIAKAAIPFVRETGHDKWLLTVASVYGSIAVYDSPAVLYRRHGKNVSGVLTGVSSKQDYYSSRFAASKAIVSAFTTRFPNNPHVRILQETLDAQVSHNILSLIKMRKYIPDIYLFQVGLALCPEPVFKALLKGYRAIAPK